MGLGKSGAILTILCIGGLAVIYGQIKSGQTFENIETIGYGLAGLAILGVIVTVKGIHWHGRGKGWWK